VNIIAACSTERNLFGLSVHLLATNRTLTLNRLANFLQSVSKVKRLAAEKVFMNGEDFLLVTNGDANDLASKSAIQLVALN
jgi:hypothetical protein